MRTSILAGIVLLGTVAQSIATAGVTLPVTATAGSSFTVDFNGHTTSSNIIDGLTSAVTFSNFSFTDNSLFNWTRVQFQAEVTNNSSAPITASRVSGLGFRTSPNISNSILAPHSVTGVFDSVSRNGNMPNLGTMEFCLSDNNCAGGGGGGVTQGNTGTAYASVYFSGTGLRELRFDEMFVRYQSIAGAAGTTSAVGSPMVPEPAAYVVLSAGLIIVGLQRRRRIAAGPSAS